MDQRELPTVLEPEQPHVPMPIRAVRWVGQQAMRLLHGNDELAAAMHEPDSANDIGAPAPVAEPDEEREAKVSELYDGVKSLFADERRMPQIVALAAKLDSTAISRRLAAIDERLRSTLPLDMRDAANNNDAQWSADLAAEQKRLYDDRADLVASDSAAASEYANTAAELDLLANRRMTTLAYDDPESQALLRAIQDAPAIQPDLDRAPFGENASRETDASHEAVLTYLDGLTFFDQSFLEYMILTGGVVITPQEGQLFEVPMSTMVSAASFESWRGRRAGVGKEWWYELEGGKHQRGDNSSLGAIKHYAGLPTDVPPIKRVRVMVQPNGKILCDNDAGDSHRVAAAFLRGNRTLKAEQIEVRLLSYNIVP